MEKTFFFNFLWTYRHLASFSSYTCKSVFYKVENKFFWSFWATKAVVFVLYAAAYQLELLHIIITKAVLVLGSVGCFYEESRG